MGFLVPSIESNRKVRDRGFFLVSSMKNNKDRYMGFLVFRWEVTSTDVRVSLFLRWRIIKTSHGSLPTRLRITQRQFSSFFRSKVTRTNVRVSSRIIKSYGFPSFLRLKTTKTYNLPCSFNWKQQKRQPNFSFFYQLRRTKCSEKSLGSIESRGEFPLYFSPEKKKQPCPDRTECFFPSVVSFSCVSVDSVAVRPHLILVLGLP